MGAVHPVRLRFVTPAWQGEVPSPPHDALSPEARRRHLAANPRSYLGVTRAPEDGPMAGPDAAAEALRAGRATLIELLADGVFGAEEGPGYFIYRLENGGHRQAGLVCTVDTAAYDDGTVRIHERINRSRAAHLASHLRIVGAQSSPIALAYRGAEVVTELIADATTREDPFVEIDDDDGLRQSLWRLEADDVPAIATALSDHPLYLIDGHHRAAAASADLAANGPHPIGDHRILSVLFPYEELRNLAFHRLLTGIDTTTLAAGLAERFPTRSAAGPAAVVDRADTELAVALPGSGGGTDWLLVDIPFDDPAPRALANIDPIRLATHLLGPTLDLVEGDDDPRLEYRPGEADVDAVRDLAVRADQALFLMRPVPLTTLMECSDAGQVMPPKSTYFQPKVRSGLFVRLIDPALTGA
ncbi:MAG: DUF1015 domain-containing protein [Actinomycetota bacterium]